MKTKNKPDLLFVLALFVGAGVLISTYGNGMFPQSEETTEIVSSSVSSKTAKTLYQGNFIKVSNKKQPGATADLVVNEKGNTALAQKPQP